MKNRSFYLVLAVVLAALQSPASTHKLRYVHVDMDGTDRPQYVVIGISNRFSDSQKRNIQDAIKYAMAAVSYYWHETRIKKRTPEFSKCVKQFTTGHWKASWDQKERTKDQVIESVMSGLTYIFNKHRTQETRGWVEPMFVEPVNGSYKKGQATLGKKFTDADFRISLNTYAVDFFDRESLGGTVFHELMHRLGFNHADNSQGSFIKEAGLCVEHRYDRAGLNLTSDYRHQE